MVIRASYYVSPLLSYSGPDYAPPPPPPVFLPSLLPSLIPAASEGDSPLALLRVSTSSSTFVNPATAYVRACCTAAECSPPPLSVIFFLRTSLNGRFDPIYTSDKVEGGTPIIALPPSSPLRKIAPATLRRRKRGGEGEATEALFIRMPELRK